MSAAIVWDFPRANPVIRPGQIHGDLDARHAGAGHVLDLGDRFRIYYWGKGSRDNVILAAEAPRTDPHAWRPLGGVLLERQPETEHNAGGPCMPFVLPVDETRWLMALCAWGRAQPGNPLPNTTLLALSDDAGLTWRYHDANPILPLDRPYDRSGTGSVSIVRHAGEFRMYYTAIGEWYDRPDGVRTGHGDRIPRIGVGYAVSRDGLVWNKPLPDLLIAPRGFGADPYEYICSMPRVMRDGAGWRMFISTFGPAYRVRSLVSPDGLAWTHAPSGPDGELGVGAAGAFDDYQRSYACAVREADTYHLWYTGNGFGATGMGYARGRLA
jgi:hypothetical protein